MKLFVGGCNKGINRSSRKGALGKNNRLVPGVGTTGVGAAECMIFGWEKPALKLFEPPGQGARFEQLLTVTNLLYRRIQVHKIAVKPRARYKAE